MIDIEQRIITFTDADGNSKFAEVREYAQYETLKAVLPVSHEVLEFDFDGMTDDDKEGWTVEIDGVEFFGTFSNVAEIVNTGKFTDVVKKPKTNRLDISQ